MHFILLAAGDGTRLAPYTDLVPKALIPVAGRPVIRYALDKIYQSYGKPMLNPVTVICQAKHYKQFLHEFEDLFDQDLFRFDLVAHPQPLGTAGEIQEQARNIEEDFMVIYADDLTQIDYWAVAHAWEGVAADARPSALLVGTAGYRLDVGVLRIHTVTEPFVRHELLGLDEKPYFDGLTWTGCGIFARDALKFFKRDKDIASEVVPAMLRNGHHIEIFRVNSPWFDIGTLRNLRRAEQAVEDGTIRGPFGARYDGEDSL